MSKEICKHCQLTEFDALMALLGYLVLFCSMIFGSAFLGRALFATI